MVAVAAVVVAVVVVVVVVVSYPCVRVRVATSEEGALLMSVVRV